MISYSYSFIAFYIFLKHIHVFLLLLKLVLMFIFHNKVFYHWEASIQIILSKDLWKQSQKCFKHFYSWMCCYCGSKKKRTLYGSRSCTTNSKDHESFQIKIFSAWNKLEWIPNQLCNKSTVFLSVLAYVSLHNLIGALVLNAHVHWYYVCR